MKPLLKRQDCLDHDPIERWCPEDLTMVDYWLCLHIGPADDIGEEMFYVNVLSELAASKLSQEELAHRKKIVLQEYSWPAVISAVDLILRASEGSDWDEIAEKLSKKFDWEFENYKPLKKEPNQEMQRTPYGRR